MGWPGVTGGAIAFFCASCLAGCGADDDLMSDQPTTPPLVHDGGTLVDDETKLRLRARPRGRVVRVDRGGTDAPTPDAGAASD